MTPPWSPVLQAIAIAILAAWSPLANAQGDAQSGTASPEPTSVASTCDAITINYITHSLPQSCLTSSWASAEPSSVDSTANPSADATDTSASSVATPDETPSPTASIEPENDIQEDQGDADGAAKPFMSFEDWKEMMLRETGQDPQDLRARNPDRPRADDRTPPHMGHAGLGEEDEINLNFNSYIDNKPQEHVDQATGSHSASTRENAVEPVASDDNIPSIHRSKDAGKTCKERFSYSSFDAGATVLKSSRGAKNAKGILVEYKDSYMLLECSAKQKFVIVELSDDILIDTIVLANFEFFSSMIRHFRVSVSDRYPVKSDRWRDLGIFEARNSRDIQPFLVENPQIWAKYVQIEFLTHYGNEYYCPVSLLRVHGSRMLDSWKDSEATRDEDSQADEEPEPQTEMQIEATKPSSMLETADPQKTAEAPIVQESLTCTVVEAAHLFERTATTCPASLNQTAADGQSQNDSQADDSANVSHGPQDPAEGRKTANMPVTRTESPTNDESSVSAPITTTSPSDNPQATSPRPSSASSASSSASDAATNSTVQVTTTKGPSMSESSSSTTVAPVSKSSPPAAAGAKNRTSGAPPPAAPPPPVQEGFFKAITKRLQQVESNLTLSLKYVEDQARHLSDSLHRTEQKQVVKLDNYLENLNQTVLGELRTLRDQYDQIWQSTVIALQSQRDQSQREIVALSTRLNVLADEVVFQKRMAIVQAGLLLSCLFLVIFSRSTPFMDQANAPLMNHQPLINGRPLMNGSPGQARVQDVFARDSSLAHDLHPASSQLHEQYTSEEQAALLQSERLSPPPTPTLMDDRSIPDIPIQIRPNQPPFHRHPSSKQQGNVSKPLPAVPENTSSP